MNWLDCQRNRERSSREELNRSETFEPKKCATRKVQRKGELAGGLSQGGRNSGVKRYLCADRKRVGRANTQDSSIKQFSTAYRLNENEKKEREQDVLVDISI